MRKAISVLVNGESWDLEVEPNDVLVDVLRGRLGVKSPKIGCERGDCGTCTVILDGRAVRSCLILAIEADGHEIVTVEGLSQAGITRLQRTFVDHSAFQCGFCAPGIVLAVHELLGRNPRPTRQEVQHAISGNLCRCTGYHPIVDAVLDHCAKAEAQAETQAETQAKAHSEAHAEAQAKAHGEAHAEAQAKVPVPAAPHGNGAPRPMGASPESRPAS